MTAAAGYRVARWCALLAVLLVAGGLLMPDFLLLLGDVSRWILLGMGALLLLTGATVLSKSLRAADTEKFIAEHGTEVEMTLVEVREARPAGNRLYVWDMGGHVRWTEVAPPREGLTAGDVVPMLVHPDHPDRGVLVDSST